MATSCVDACECGELRLRGVVVLETDTAGVGYATRSALSHSRYAGCGAVTHFQAAPWAGEFAQWRTCNPTPGERRIPHRAVTVNRLEQFRAARKTSRQQTDREPVQQADRTSDVNRNAAGLAGRLRRPTGWLGSVPERDFFGSYLGRWPLMNSLGPPRPGR